MIRGRLATLYRKVYPVGLEREWYRFLQAADATRRRLDPEAELLDEATLRGMAREGAATGRDPGDVLAELLVEQAARRGA
jgi:hypothetical protein